jgi:predicted acetyltransferase
MQLVVPSLDRLSDYVAALETGWSPDTVRKDAAAREQLARIEQDADAFLASQVDREARGPLVTLPDGSQVPRLPGFLLWLWDGSFCGAINLRWQKDGQGRATPELPPHVMGHVGYAVVPWRRGRGLAKSALAQLLPMARDEGLPHVLITTDLDNLASQRIIEANGGQLQERFTKPASYGGAEALRYRIDLA